MKLFKITSLVVLVMVSLYAVSSTGLATTIPEGYAQDKFSIGDKWVYDITASNGVVIGWGGFAGNYSSEVNGQIEFTLVGFSTTWSGDIPFFNITFKLANGQVNGTIANISNEDLAFLFTLNIGMFVPGAIAKINWTENTLLAQNEVNTPADQPYSMNGTLTVTTQNGRVTYDYKQNESNGDQKCKLVYDESSGIIQSWNSSIFNYYMTAVLHQHQDDNKISGYNLPIIIVSAIAIIGLIKRKK
jgi:hypothetical protein